MGAHHMIRVNVAQWLSLVLIATFLSSCGAKMEEDFATVDNRGNTSSDKELERAERETSWG